MIERFDRIQFYMTFPSVPVPAAEVWNILAGYLEQHGALPKQFEFQQNHTTRRLKLSPSEVSQVIETRQLEGFAVDAGRLPRGMAFKLGRAGQLGGQTSLYSVIESKSQAPDHWSGMLESLMARFPATGAWQWRGLYKAWQGANCVEASYEDLYGSLPPEFKTRQEPTVPGFPDKTIIDISLNPGRPKELHPGSHFYPTAEMWLGPHFWQHAKCTKDDVLAADFFTEKRDTPHFVYLKCWPQAFTRPDGEQGRMQQRLWKLFFHEDCEWPPGSGGISDDPIHGPPELMPGFKP